MDESLETLNDNMDSVSEYVPFAYFFILIIGIIVFIVYCFCLVVVFL